MNRPYTVWLHALILLLCLSAQAALAQTANEIRLSGIVISESDGKPLPGATVLIQATNKGTTTDADGRFQLMAGLNATLQVSFIGYRSRSVAVDNRTELTIALTADESNLAEVVVVGYGTQKRRDVTGSIASVSAAAIKEMPITSAEQGLQGRVAGVQVIQSNSAPGGAVSIRVRGGNSVLGGNEPLYVIDGFPVYNSIGTNDGQSQPTNPLATINPNDIVSMEVLKDASATAIFGARGANGVVIVTTRRGKAGPGTVDVEAYYGVQTVRRKIPLLNGSQYMDLANEKARNLGQTTLPFPDKSKWPVSTDWQEELFRPAPIRNYALTFSGGSETSRYAISGNWFDQQGIVTGSGFRRGSLRANMDNTLSRKLSLSTSITASRTINQQARTSINFGNGVVYNALISSPLASVYNPDGSYFPVSTIPATEPFGTNPLALAREFSNELVTNRILANTNLTYALTAGLTLSVRLGIDYSNDRTDRYFSRKLPGSTGQAGVITGEGSTYLNENILTYKKQFGADHTLDATGGFTWQESVFSSLSASSQNFAVDLFGTDNLSAGNSPGVPASGRSKNSLLSWLGRVNYGFKDRYLLTVSARADGSSRFGSGNKWGFFPSAALAWRVSEEPFMKAVNWVSDLKLRTSVGVTGNQEIGNYQSLNRLSTVGSIQGVAQSPAVGFAVTTMANPDLKWETTTQYDAGLDVGLWNGRINLSLDYYVKNTTDLLAQVPVAISSGFSSILLNSGSIRNRGVDVSLDGTILNRSRLRWNAGVNLSTNRNRVQSVAVRGGQFFAPLITSPVDLPVNIIREGQPVSAFFGYVRDGLWGEDQGASSLMPNARAGEQRYKDLNGDGKITADDRTVLGKPNPDFIYGLTSQLTYGPFDLNILFQGVQGATVFNANNFTLSDVFARGNNQLADITDRWTTENRNVNAKYPRASSVSPLVSDRFFEDASYFRLRNIQVGYNLPVGSLGVKWFRSARVYLSGQNLLTVTRYTGFDPEVSSTAGSDLRKGVDIGAYPAAKMWTAGLRLGF
ncbi:SusC/RagA family TonB-linked outer membrane protein [Larkinella soli]|uniref:SusC/RagA family TonB-linked outer membrane protein n=1 Tax=Larkinella soli TaxID=1770527 RepID=UPI000FFB51D9|nr:TonB-dependent receptor [Larkinella soli]